MADAHQGTVRYHKGHMFLAYLEQAFGRDAFDAFLKSYFEEFAFGTITTEQFLDYLDVRLLAREGAPLTRAEVERWTYGPGLPDDVSLPSSANLDTAETAAQAWSAGDTELADIVVDDWSPQARIHFINSLPADLSPDKIRELDEAWRLSTSTNAEIGRTWFIQVASRRHVEAYDALEAFVNRHGRGRLVVPIYRALAENGKDLELAQALFEQARAKYHPATVAWVESSLREATD